MGRGLFAGKSFQLLEFELWYPWDNLKGECMSVCILLCVDGTEWGGYLIRHNEVTVLPVSPFRE